MYISLFHHPLRRPLRLKRTTFPILLLIVVLLSCISYEAYLRGQRPSYPRPFNQFENESDNLPPAYKSSPKILLVSAFFPLSKSKHSSAEYESWSQNFIAATRNTPVYLFIPPSLVSSLLPSPLPSNIILNTTFTDVWQLPPVAGLEQAFEEMHDIGREKKIHSPELYAIWNAKPWLTEEGMKNSRDGNNFEWDYVFWTDVGGFRDTWYNSGTWPLSQKVLQTWKEVGEKQQDTEHKMFLPIYNMPHRRNRDWKELNGPIDEDISEAGFFGGSPSAIQWFKSTFYAYRDYYISQSFFVGKEQLLFNSLLLMFPSRFITVHVNDPHALAYIHPTSMWDQRWLRHIMRKYFRNFYETRALGRCRGEYMYYQFFFADKTTRERLQDMWLADVHDNWDDWFGSGQSPGVSERCRMTRAISVLEAFRREGVLGPDWNPPRRTVVV
ncbi:hypothetical protein L218DRAFT_856467 [Marasmius fiardii PR-910]|nr:hypothetical protein L218DRAFT_856467 [Marasmius fiardii PR-910]